MAGNQEAIERLIREPKEREERHRRFLEGTRITRDYVESTAIVFTRLGDFDNLVAAAREAYHVARRFHPFHPWGFADFYTTLFSRMDGNPNRRIIQEAEKRGIKPAGNVSGERLEAMTCLAQFLETEEKR